MTLLPFLTTEKTNWKQQTLPLARIKKIMKSDEVVYAELEKEINNLENGEAPTQNPRFMIAGEAPILLGKACEMLVKELSIRSWKHTERNRRRTLQKQDVHAAVGESEVYDFLIDIVPRVQMQPAVKGFTPPIPSTQQDQVQQASHLTSSVVNEIPTINHALQVHAPTSTATTLGAQSQLQQMMPHAQMQVQNASHQSQLQQMTPQGQIQQNAPHQSQLQQMNPQANATHQSQLQQMTPQAQIQAQNSSHQSQIQQMMPQAQIQAQTTSHQSQLQQMMPQAQLQAQYTIMQQHQQHDTGNHHYQQQQYVGRTHNIEGNSKS
jgi:nuclear transcription factor Y gamma